MNIFKCFKRPPANPVQIETYKAANGQFYNRIKRSGQIIFDGSEGYHNRQDAESTVKNTVQAIKSGNVELRSLSILLVGLLLGGCALIPSNESKSANAKTAGGMNTEQNTTARVVVSEGRQIFQSRTNADGIIEVTTHTVTATNDSEKWDYSYVKSLPVLLTVGFGMIAIGVGAYVLLRVHKAAKASSAAYAAVSEASDRGLASLVNTIKSHVDSTQDPQLKSLLSSLHSEALDHRRKVQSI